MYINVKRYNFQSTNLSVLNEAPKFPFYIHYFFLDRLLSIHL